MREHSQSDHVKLCDGIDKRNYLLRGVFLEGGDVIAIFLPVSDLSGLLSVPGVDAFLTLEETVPCMYELLAGLASFLKS